MFYYPAVLKRHTGCFSTIWLVATKGIKVSRRDFLKVNVKRTCDDIMNYVLERVPPPQPGLPRPRFSLYLSSQLQYGVILVFHRQCAILLEELQTIVGQLVKQRTPQKIDLEDSGRQSLDLPDALSLLQEAEGAPDPLFGVMQLRDTIPSPTTLIQASEEYLREASPERPELSPAASAGAAAAQDGITASPDSITLKESPPASIPSAEFEGADFADDDLRTIDLLRDATDHFPEGDSETLTEKVTPAEPEMELERDEGDEGTPKELTGSITELQPTITSTEDLLPPEPTEEPDLPREEPVLPTEEPTEEPGPPADQLTPTSVPVIPSPPSAAPRGQPELEDEVITGRRRRRRRRQLTFFDPETQIPEEEQQQQINNPLTQTRPPVLVTPPGQRIRTAADLLSNPCSFLPKEVELLWRQAAVVTPMSGSELQVGERGPESTESERDREPEMMPEEEEEEEETLEVPREMEEPEVLDISALGSLPLEASDQRDVSREISPVQTSEREGSIVSRSVSTLQDIPEVVDELREAAESPGLLPEFPERDPESVLFSSLLPPNASRKTVSNIFHRLLETLSARRVRAEQDEPYADILILPGPDYERAQ